MVKTKHILVIGICLISLFSCDTENNIFRPRCKKPNISLSEYGVLKIGSDVGSTIIYNISTDKEPPDPDSASHIYKGPIALIPPKSGRMWIKAVAFKDGYRTSKVAQFQFGYDEEGEEEIVDTLNVDTLVAPTAQIEKVFKEWQKLKRK